MLGLERLERIPILQTAGWTRTRAGHLQERLYHRDPHFPPQVPEDAIFPAAWEIIDALEGICIPNQCPELGLGATCHAIEFDFLGYDSSVLPELEIVNKELGQRVLFLGIGYDIAGDWLVDETGTLYFWNRLTQRRFPFSTDIYSFLEKDVYGFSAIDGSSIFSRETTQKYL